MYASTLVATYVHKYICMYNMYVYVHKCACMYVAMYVRMYIQNHEAFIPLRVLLFHITSYYTEQNSGGVKFW